MKRGLTPLVGIVLLIGLVVALAAITLNWGAGVLTKRTEEAQETVDVQLDFAQNVKINVPYIANHHGTPDYVYVEIENLKEREIEDFVMQLRTDTVTFSNPSIGEGLSGFGVESYEVVFEGYDPFGGSAPVAREAVIIPVVRDQFGDLKVAEGQAFVKKFMCLTGVVRRNGDINGDGFCTGEDINILVEYWGQQGNLFKLFPCIDIDFNCDNKITQPDLGIALTCLPYDTCVDLCKSENDGDYCVSLCNNGKDDDWDGFCDYDGCEINGEWYPGDDGCSGYTDDSEKVECADEIDNDRDGATDLDDFSCGNDPNDDDETNPKAQCQNRLDDDNDGFCDYCYDSNDDGVCDNTCEDGQGVVGDSRCVDFQDNSELI